MRSLTLTLFFTCFSALASPPPSAPLHPGNYFGQGGPDLIVTSVDLASGTLQLSMPEANQAADVSVFYRQKNDPSLWLEFVPSIDPEGRIEGKPHADGVWLKVTSADSFQWGINSDFEFSYVRKNKAAQPVPPSVEPQDFDPPISADCAYYHLCR